MRGASSRCESGRDGYHSWRQCDRYRTLWSSKRRVLQAPRASANSRVALARCHNPCRPRRNRSRGRILPSQRNQDRVRLCAAREPVRLRRRRRHRHRRRILRSSSRLDANVCPWRLVHRGVGPASSAANTAHGPPKAQPIASDNGSKNIPEDTRQHSNDHENQYKQQGTGQIVSSKTKVGAGAGAKGSNINAPTRPAPPRMGAPSRTRGTGAGPSKRALKPAKAKARPRPRPRPGPAPAAGRDVSQRLQLSPRAPGAGAVPSIAIGARPAAETNGGCGAPPTGSQTARAEYGGGVGVRGARAVAAAVEKAQAARQQQQQQRQRQRLNVLVGRTLSKGQPPPISRWTAPSHNCIRGC